MDTSIIPEPILLSPRLDAKPWGSTSLSQFGIDLGGNDSIGEAVLTSADVRVLGGRFDGQTLGQLVARNPEMLLGARGFALGGENHEFPLLAKLIDANAFLSIQVHPTDDISPPGCLGKTEAWYILKAELGATVLAGLVDGVTKADVAAAIDAGQSLVPLVRSVPVRPGEVLFLPAGTIHALGSGIVIYEIQQPSFVTYRLEDWGRAREMHIEDGLAALDDSIRPVPLAAPNRIAGTPPQPAVGCPYFALERMQVEPSETFMLPAEDGPQVFTCIDGSTELGGGQSNIGLAKGATAVMFANAGPARFASQTGATILRAWLG